MNKFFELYTKKDFFMLAVPDNDMAPNLLFGDIVACQKQKTVKNGMLAAIILDDAKDVTFRHVYVFSNGIILKSKNEKPILLRGKDVERVQILGAVVCLIMRDVTNDKTESRFLHFTRMERRRMPKSFREQFEAQGSTAIVSKTIEEGKNRYQISYKRNGYNYAVVSDNLTNAKQKFLAALLN